jgi:sortase A
MNPAGAGQVGADTAPGSPVLVHLPSPGAPDDRTSNAGQSAMSRRVRSVRSAWYVVRTTILILLTALLGFAAWLGMGSRLQYDRAQHGGRAAFQAELALARAPTGATQPGHPGKLLTLGTPVAVLTIPQIGLSAVVLEGTTGQVLEDGPGHLRDTPMPGQAGVSVILGRQAAFGGPFSRISMINAGAIFTVTTGAGVSRYRVLDVRRPGDPMPPPVPAGAGRLILATANGIPFVPAGLLEVDANLTSAPKPASAMVVSAADLRPGEQPLGVDTAAWVPMVLWGEGLVLAAVALSWLGPRWGRWRTRMVAVPVLVYLCFAAADQVARLLPNLM